MRSYDDIKEILDSEAGDIARKLDADDGNYDGLISIKILNKFLRDNNFKTYQASNDTDLLPFMDVVKMIYSLKRDAIATGQTMIKVDFDPVEEMRKAKLAYKQWS